MYAKENRPYFNILNEVDAKAVDVSPAAIRDALKMRSFKLYLSQHNKETMNINLPIPFVTVSKEKIAFENNPFDISSYGDDYMYTTLPQCFWVYLNESLARNGKPVVQRANWRLTPNLNSGFLNMGTLFRDEFPTLNQLVYQGLTRIWNEPVILAADVPFRAPYDADLPFSGEKSSN
jgi:hypothetical protein